MRVHTKGVYFKVYINCNVIHDYFSYTYAIIHVKYKYLYHIQSINTQVYIYTLKGCILRDIYCNVIHDYFS